MLQEDVQTLTRRLQDKQHFDAILAVGRGGFIPAVYLSHSLNINRIYTCQVESYDDKTQHYKKLFQWISLPRWIELSRRHILVVDDIIDTGNTMKSLIKRLENNNVHYTIAVLVDKVQTHSPIDAFFFARQCDDWIMFPWERV